MATANPTGTEPRSRVLLTRRIPSSTLAILAAGASVELYDGPTPIPDDELKRRLRGKHGMVSVLTDRVTAGVLEAATELKVVSNIAVGFDNIDVAAARARGIVVTNTPDVLTNATAELTWALILAVTRRIAEGDRLIRRHGWKGWALDFMLGTELRGKQLGIIGRGRIGRAVGERAAAFGMHPVYATRGERTHDLPEMSLDELLVSSDVISIHTPLSEANRHLIDRRALARMKRTAYLVNTARGPIVDEEALAWALKERLIAGAALDVYEREPEVFAALLDLDNVVLAPHLGSATRETRTAMIELAIRNALAVLHGKPALTPVP
ncbi:MAG TPA: D-glycerate dehydrogenase [Vicinamibacterales bacterium]|nr:D-glycerate dehydrogenase [Vicinamibacterales bacterium]